MQTKRYGWTKLMVAGVLAWATFVVVAGLPAAKGAVLVSDGFESDTVNGAPRVLPGGPNPAGWGVAFETNSVNGLVDASVEGVGSAFGGGSKSLLIYDQNTTTETPIPLWAYKTFGPTNTLLGVSFDVKANQLTAGTALMTRLLSGVVGTASMVLQFLGDGSTVTFTDGGTPLQTISTGVWYKITLELPVASSSAMAYQIHVTDSSTWTTSSYVGSRVASVSDWGTLLFSTATSPSIIGDFNIDNVEIYTLVPEPTLLGLLAVGGLLVLARRSPSATSSGLSGSSSSEGGWRRRKKLE